ncbi:hypothetical protein V6N12_066828 [Hibiscus sabdariffa]|uniref:Uncharacterized protein n=1 Tax=Hibiscus sabdariffa TaxID=183260 RepID=A0ABR2C9A6_9ROSI
MVNFAPSISDNFQVNPRVVGDSPSTIGVVGEPGCVDDQHVVKRSPGDGDDFMDVAVGDVISNMEEGLVDTSGDGMICDESGSKQVNDGSTESTAGGVPTKPTFHDMLTGWYPDVLPAPTILDLDVEIHDEDVQISIMDDTHVINFSNRLHKDVCKKSVDEENARQYAKTSDMTLNHLGDMFGPWMQAPTRKARKAMNSKSDNASENLNREQAITYDNATLVEVDKDVVDGSDLEKSMENHGNVQIESMEVHVIQSDGGRVLLCRSWLKSSGKSSGEGNQGGKFVVASLNVIIPAQVTLNTDALLAVRVVERGSELASKNVDG